MGTILPGRFEPIRLLRKDRGCSTFVATDRGLGRNEVVVKLIGKGHFTSDTDALVDVFSWYRGLRHVFISEVLDAGVTAKRELFYVRTYHPPSEFFTTSDTDSLKALVSAVDFLHAMGRAHGSIKPSNVFAGRGRMKIADPSICRNLTDPRRSLTEEDIRFSAPEVLSGGDISLDSDLYSLGALLYRFFSGRDPFEDSDLESLKAKYIWASPRSLGSVSHVSKVMGDIVTNLLDKDPRVRIAAFESLKEELDIAAARAVRAPAVGRREDVEKVLTQLIEKPRLSMVLVEGPEGTGKSRFVEELQNRASLGGHVLVACETKAQDPLMDLARKAVSVVDEQGLGAGAASLSRLRRFASEEPEPASKSEQGEIERDLLSLLASISRQTRLLLVIEDVDRAGRKLKGLIEAIVQQLSDLELSILVTARSGGTPIKTISSSRDFLGEDFHLLALGLLNPADSAILSAFFSSDRDRRSQAEQKAAGNPFFLEEYCKSSGQTGIPKRVRTALSGAIFRLSIPIRRAAEILSLFEHPVDWSLLSRVSGISGDSFRQSVSALRQLGLARTDGLSIRYPDARTLLHSRISKSRRTELHTRCFRHLKEEGCSDSILADHAFQGEQFEIAGALYRQLARDSFSAKNYRDAARYYSAMAECRVKDSLVPALDPPDNVRLATCCAYQGEKGRARRILDQVLKASLAQEDSALLSSVYATLASPLIEDSGKERVRLLELAIRCLNVDSPEMLHRYRALVTAFLCVGDSTNAENALKSIELYCNSREDLQQLEDIRASVFMNQGNFKEAAQCLLSRQFLWSTPGGVSNNLAVCIEQLGDLKRAREIQTVALQEAQASGSLFLQVISLSNLGAMETKLGNLKAGERFLSIAHSRIREVQRQDGEAAIGKFSAAYTDIAAHFIQRGDYRKAAAYLGRINMEYAGPFPLELFLIAVTRCELHIELGQAHKARAVLESTKDLSLQGNFFEVERLLIEAQLREPSLELCAQLDQALEFSTRLETLYQECRVQITLARVLLELGDFMRASVAARSARRVSTKNGYRSLAARALLLIGLSTTQDGKKDFALRRSLDESGEIGLSPLMAECAYQIGSWQLAQGHYVDAREFLSKSLSITTRLAEELVGADRRSYLARAELKQTRVLLNEASARASSLPSKKVPELLDKESAFFVRLYRLAAAMTAAVDLDAAMSTLLEALKDAMNHPAVVISGMGAQMMLHPVRASITDEMSKRIVGIASSSGEKPYITGVGTSGRRDTAAWLPILSAALRGGIYVECLAGHSLDEREIEFLTVVTAIAGAAFDHVCGKTGMADVNSSSQFCGIVGTSKKMGDVRARIEIAATNAATVLIEGESGTGKELVAKAIHERSARAKAPFVPVDCGALPEGLIEAELFGAKKGAYTGALTDRQGLFEAAHNGTIFLDEISNLGMPAQAKLLRVLQEREVRRIGSTTGKVVDVRLIAATNCNLEKLVRQGQFRQDLLYRLKVLHILLPPLRDRKDDIPLLATAFLGRLNAQSQTNKYFGPRVMESFLGHDYPGNVRELQNAVERGFYSTNSAVVTHVDFLGETSSIDSPGQNETASWFKELTEGRENFWSAVHDRYKSRDISRERVVALVDYGLRATRGSYSTMASMLQIPKEEYHRFMDFLRRNRCLLDFRPYRTAE